jgi:hypothetical protein
VGIGGGVIVALLRRGSFVRTSVTLKSSPTARAARKSKKDLAQDGVEYPESVEARSYGFYSHVHRGFALSTEP